jgi:polar amino acid transport system substrate-binding protein
MKTLKNRSVVPIFLLFIFFTTVHSTESWGQCKLSFHFTTIEPFVMGTAEKPTGFDIEILEAISKNAGCSVKYIDKEIPWARRLKMIESGQLSLLNGTSWKPERAEYANYTTPYRFDYQALFVRKGESKNYPYRTLTDLIDSNFRLGVNRGATYGTLADKIISEMGTQIEYATGAVQNGQKLLRKRIDGYLSFIPYESLYIKSQGFAIEQHPMELINTGAVYFMVSKKGVSLENLNGLNYGMAKIIYDGTYDQIVAKYSKQYGVSKW